MALLRHCPAYRETPLRDARLGSGLPLFIKDETDRMGCGSFKILGGAYAVAALIAERWHGLYGNALAPEDLMDERVRDMARAMEFVCASAGNHGLAVATGAKLFGAKATVILSRSVPPGFEARLQSHGAEVLRRGATYEDSMAASRDYADETGAILLADTAWPGYRARPRLVMEGYTVLAEELRTAFERRGDWPTDVFLQAGVGGFAGATTYMIRKNWSVQPNIYIVEPDAAPCLAASHAAGEPATVEGPESNMGRLDCKEASPIAVEIFRDADLHYIAISDAQAEAAAQQLTELNLPTTPSGAAGLAGMQTVMDDVAGTDFRPLIVVTEGPA